MTLRDPRLRRAVAAPARLLATVAGSAATRREQSRDRPATHVRRRPSSVPTDRRTPKRLAPPRPTPSVGESGRPAGRLPEYRAPGRPRPARARERASDVARDPGAVASFKTARRGGRAQARSTGPRGAEWERGHRRLVHRSVRSRQPARRDEDRRDHVRGGLPVRGSAELTGLARRRAMSRHDPRMQYTSGKRIDQDDPEIGWGLRCDGTTARRWSAPVRHRPFMSRFW